MNLTDERMPAVSASRGMTRARFLRLGARVAGACAAGSVLGPDLV